MINIIFFFVLITLNIYRALYLGNLSLRVTKKKKKKYKYQSYILNMLGFKTLPHQTWGLFVLMIPFQIAIKARMLKFMALTELLSSSVDTLSSVIVPNGLYVIMLLYKHFWIYKGAIFVTHKVTTIEQIFLLCWIL